MMHRQTFLKKNASIFLGIFSSVIWGVVEFAALQRLRYHAWRAEI